MRMHTRHVSAALLFGIVGLCGAPGCSSGSDSEPASPSAQTPTTSEESETPTPAPGALEVSPDGVTTAIGSPAESTEEEYFQACKAARDWMEQQGGASKERIEPYLKEVQSTDSAGPGTFGSPWSQLSQTRQAAVIVAVQAAADELCG